jgi:hypothetical protein
MPTILFLTASPSQVARLNLEREANMIQDAILHQTWGKEFHVVQRWKTQATELQPLLQSYKPDIVHFSSHGTEDHQIILEDAQGKVAAVSASMLGKLFALHQANIRCVVLNACYSQAQAAAIAAHIPCVIGMNDAIEDSMAQQFTAAFYAALADGSDIHSAFGQGALQIEIHGDPTQASIPVLLPDMDAGKGLVLASGQHTIFAPAPLHDQELYRRVLREFLLPLRMHLAITRRTFDRLVYERSELAFLERPLASLQHFFDNLPDEDARKALWMTRIDLLVTENGKAATLVEKHIGDVVRPDFYAACIDYLDHVKTWEAAWQAMRAGRPVPASTPQIAPRFPDQFEHQLQAELQEVRTRAGLP